VNDRLPCDKSGEGVDPKSGSDVDFHSEIFDEAFEEKMNKKMIEIIKKYRDECRGFLWDDLKQTIRITDSTVECPVKGCSHVVERQKGRFVRDDKFLCPTHRIFITASTFVYKDLWCNLTEWAEEDRELFDRLTTVKREGAGRFAHNNSEDAVTWNVFRHLEKQKLIDAVIREITGEKVATSEVIYWSYSQNQQGPWQPLVSARNEFGETPNRSTEPDVIIETDKVLVFVECKVGSASRTRPSNTDNPKRYEVGGDNWFHKVFRPEENFVTVADDAELYELMRMWLLGTWIAENEFNGKKFVLLNLVRKRQELDIEELFGNKIVVNENRRFKRYSWEELYCQVRPAVVDPRFHRFFTQKTMGYRNGQLQKMFDLECP
jgi:hypothetical protein